MRITPESILRKLRILHRNHRRLSEDSETPVERSLVSAAVRHFGSLEKAIEAAGIPREETCSRPKWTKQQIIRTIKQARRAGLDLSWSAVITTDSPLRRAAFAAVHRRMFGGWPRALEAAGVDADAARRYQEWSRTIVVFELKQFRAEGETLRSSAVRKRNPALHAAAIRYFGSFAQALVAARLTVRTRRRKKGSKG